jgi:hypothetical protein
MDSRIIEPYIPSVDYWSYYADERYLREDEPFFQWMRGKGLGKNVLSHYTSLLHITFERSSTEKSSK